MAFSMRIAYFDCFSGVSGDMCLGALVDTGLPLADLSEGLAHRTMSAKVHFHELGGLDALVDVVGTVLGCHLLGVEALYVSAINVGSGTIRSEHGVSSAPAPATAALL